MIPYDSYKYSKEETLEQGPRWARDDEIQKISKRNILNNPDEQCYAGLPLISNGNIVYVDDSDSHSLILGSTGSKKSRMFVMPMLEMIWRAGDSVLVTDPKGELFDLTADEYRKAGYNVQVINLRDPRHSQGWNPFSLAREYQKQGKYDRAASIVNDFAACFIQDHPKTDPFWTYASRAMLQGLCMMMIEACDIVRDEEVNLMTLRLLSENMDNSGTLNDNTFDLLQYYPEDSLARSNLNSIVNGSERTFDNIRVSYDAPMQRLYVQNSLVQMLSENTVDFTDLGKQKSILYLIMPDEKTTLHPIVSLIIKQCYEQLIDLAQTQPQKSLNRTVHFLLDEFSNLPAIPDMPAMISAARSRNIRFTLIAQGLHQLVSKYGEDEAQTIKGNCGNWVLLVTRELELLREISELCGGDPVTRKSLISISQLQRLSKEKGEALMLIGRQHPYIAHLADISMYPHDENATICELPRLKIQNIQAVGVEELKTRFNKKYDNNVEKKEDYELQQELTAKFEELFGKNAPKE